MCVGARKVTDLEMMVAGGRWGCGCLGQPGGWGNRARVPGMQHNVRVTDGEMIWLSKMACASKLE